MTRTVVLWALVLAVGAFALRWTEYQYLARTFSFEIYVAAIATAFAAGGAWLGWRLSARPGSETFTPNDAARASLGLTGQEMRVLTELAAGRTNKEIAKSLGLSPNTVKTHVGNLYAKLDVGRRTQAVGLARDLRLIP